MFDIVELLFALCYLAQPPDERSGLRAFSEALELHDAYGRLEKARRAARQAGEAQPVKTGYVG